MDFEMLEHDEARSLFRSRRPSEALGELEYAGHQFGFEDRDPLSFAVSDLRDLPTHPVTGVTQYGPTASWQDKSDQEPGYTDVEAGYEEVAGGRTNKGSF